MITGMNYEEEAEKILAKFHEEADELARNIHQTIIDPFCRKYKLAMILNLWGETFIDSDDKEYYVWDLHEISGISEEDSKKIEKILGFSVGRYEVFDQTEEYDVDYRDHNVWILVERDGDGETIWEVREEKDDRQGWKCHKHHKGACWPHEPGVYNNRRGRYIKIED